MMKLRNAEMGETNTRKESSDEAVTIGTTAPDDSKTMNAFKIYAKKLDAKTDKFERIVKLSRDVTIENKRIIFLLHTIDRESKKLAVLNEAERRLNAVVQHQLKSVAKELLGEDPYLYHRAFSPGIQEFIEAFTYFNYLKSERMYNWEHYQSKLEYSQDEGGQGPAEGQGDNQLKTILVHTDFMLGLADVTGELMRKCINNLGVGNTEGSFLTCAIVRHFYRGFLSLDLNRQKEMSRKMVTLKQSLLKMEMACYNIRIRGSESTRLMLSDASKAYVDEDN